MFSRQYLSTSVLLLLLFVINLSYGADSPLELRDDVYSSAGLSDGRSYVSQGLNESIDLFSGVLLV